MAIKCFHNALKTHNVVQTLKKKGKCKYIYIYLFTELLTELLTYLLTYFTRRLAAMCPMSSPKY